MFSSATDSSQGTVRDLKDVAKDSYRLLLAIGPRSNHDQMTSSQKIKKLFFTYSCIFLSGLGHLSDFLGIFYPPPHPTPTHDFLNIFIGLPSGPHVL